MGNITPLKEDTKKSGYSLMNEGKHSLFNSQIIRSTIKESPNSKSPRISNKGFFSIKEIQKPLNFVNLVQEIKTQKPSKK